MLGREVLRYLLAGGVNTLVTYALYLVLLQPLGYRLAYVAAFAAGVVLSFTLLRHLVFARPGRRFSLLWVTAAHGLQLLLGLAVVEVWVAWLHAPAWLAPLAAVAVCLPIIFVLQRWVFTPYAAR